MENTIEHTGEHIGVAVRPELPYDTGGVEALLAGPRVEGIGPAFAGRLTARYGTDAVEELMRHPDRVADEISGLGRARADKASESLLKMEKELGLLLFLYSCGIGDLYIERICNKYRRRTVEVILSDPYSMVEDVWQLSFHIADKIGSKMGIAGNDPRRIQAALVTAVKLAAEMGHLFLSQEQAIASAARIAGVSPEEAAARVDDVVASGRLIKSKGVLYLPVFYAAEKEGAEKLSSLASVPLTPAEDESIPTHSLQGHLYSQQQREAIRKAIENPVLVITGGPGSGKTTVVKGIIDIMKEQGKSVVLCAPTGRAAKRLSALTECDAVTIHSLLGYRQGEGYHNKKIDCDLLIIDEGSMMEQVLFNHLLQAVSPGTRIILVGDVDQLPAIGAGDVLRDLIASDRIAVVRLDDNFRQSEGSLIAKGARAINNGELPETDPERDLVIIPEPTVSQIHDRIISLVAEELPSSRHISPTDIIVVTPQQIGRLGARQLNLDLQQRLNPDGPALRRGATTMRLGDPVMQTANSRERGVYNGAGGTITQVDTAGQRLTVTFTDGRESTYERSELSELTLAYATTIHKIQGSEARNIIIPVTMAHRPMLYRNLIYTGVSRATDLCILVGEEDALRYAIDNTPASTRNSNFRYRLQSGIANAK
ncbi:MAG: AAA family ATPase [Muribaculaceae bacterium]|nr:AAA family ATPase [Muribaculaceae bacterium]